MAIIGLELKHEAAKAFCDFWKQPETGLTTTLTTAADLAVVQREALLIATQNFCEAWEASTALMIPTSAESSAVQRAAEQSSATGFVTGLFLASCALFAALWYLFIKGSLGWKTMAEEPRTRLTAAIAILLTGVQQPPTPAGNVAAAAAPANGADETDNQGPENDCNTERLNSQATQTHDGDMTAKNPPGDGASSQTWTHHGEDITDTPANVTAPEAVDAPEAPESPATATPSTAPYQVPAAELLYMEIAERIGLCGGEHGITKDLYHAGTGHCIGKLHSFMSSDRAWKYFHHGTILEIANEKFVVVPGSLISVSESDRLASTPRNKRQELMRAGKLTEVMYGRNEKYLQIQRGSEVEFRTLRDAMAFIKGDCPPSSELMTEKWKSNDWTPPQGSITPSPAAQAPGRPQPSSRDHLNRVLARDDY